MPTRRKNDLEHEVGSGNVFADLGLPNPEERLVKSGLASRIDTVIADRGLTQAAAGELMGLDQAKVSKIVRGRLAEFSIERLMACLIAIGSDVEIVVRERPRKARLAKPRGAMTLAVA